MFTMPMYYDPAIIQPSLKLHHMVQISKKKIFNLTSYPEADDELFLIIKDYFCSLLKKKKKKD